MKLRAIFQDIVVDPFALMSLLAKLPAALQSLAAKDLATQSMWQAEKALRIFKATGQMVANQLVLDFCFDKGIITCCSVYMV